MLFIAMKPLKSKSGKIFSKGDIFELKKQSVIEETIKKSSARPIKNFCPDCALLDKEETTCSWEETLSFDKICIAPYDLKDGRLTLKKVKYK